MNTQYWARLDSPLGHLTVSVNQDGALVAIDLRGAAGRGQERPDRCREPLRQLDEYFKGQRETFDLPLRLTGSEFQRQVWQALTSIPFGDSISYGQLAQAVGRAGAARAVGQANGANPIPIVVPCHRVVASDGGMGGFSGGIELKRWLLAHEGATTRDLI